MEAQSVDKISFDCPECGAHLKVPSHLGGVTGSCPQCQKTIAAPVSSRIAYDLDLFGRKEQEEEGAAKPSLSSLRPPNQPVEPAVPASPREERLETLPGLPEVGAMPREVPEPVALPERASEDAAISRLGSGKVKAPDWPVYAAAEDAPHSVSAGGSPVTPGPRVVARQEAPGADYGDGGSPSFFPPGVNTLYPRNSVAAALDVPEPQVLEGAPLGPETYPGTHPLYTPWRRQAPMARFALDFPEIRSFPLLSGLKLTDCAPALSRD